MPTEQSGPLETSTLKPALKAFLSDIDDDGGWADDVLLRLFREGKIEAGDVSCDNALSICIRHKLVANIMDNGQNDYAYQLTNLGRLYCIQFLSNRYDHVKFKVGDVVALDPIEYDNYYSLYKIVAIQSNHVAVSLPEDWISLKGWDDLNRIRVLGIIVLDDELYHATWEEEQTKERGDAF